MVTDTVQRGRFKPHTLFYVKMKTISNKYVLSFREGVNFSECEKGFIIQNESRRLTYRPCVPEVRMLLEALKRGDSTQNQIFGLICQNGGNIDFFSFCSFLSELSHYGILSYTVSWDGRPLVTAVPLSSPFEFSFSEIDEKCQYLLSRFAYVRRKGEVMVLESPLSHVQILLRDWRCLSILGLLSSPMMNAELSDHLHEIPQEVLRNYLSLLCSCRIIQPLEGSGLVEESGNEALLQWEFHDLLFHTRSREGRHSGLSGATGRFIGKIRPLSAIKRDPPGVGIPLPSPDLEELKRSDSNFTTVMEERVSTRKFGPSPLSSSQLGEFLYRSARVKEVQEVDGIEISRRPYPGAGALYELEIYLVIDGCDGILPGLYHYDPLDHRLIEVSFMNASVEDLMRNAALAMYGESRPQVLVIYAARFQRVAWKYESIAYALIQKDVGVLMQTMSLVATAMGLASCILGSGNSDLFAQATGIDYYIEGSVGEFALGTMP